MQRFQSSEQPQAEGLAGSLLVAHPALLEPSFRKSVIYIASHDNNGSLGFVLNKPLGKSVAEIIPGEEALGPVAQMPVYQGGPVGRNQLIICVFRQDQADGAITCSHSMSAGDVESLVNDNGSILRAFVGHSGWSAGQLENELQHSSWIVKTPERELLTSDSDHSLWSSIYENMGAWGRFQAGAPDDLSLN